MTENAVEKPRDGLLNGPPPLPSPTRASESNIVTDIVPDAQVTADAKSGVNASEPISLAANDGGEHPASSFPQSRGIRPDAPAETAPSPAVQPRPPAVSPPGAVESSKGAAKACPERLGVKAEATPASPVAALAAQPLASPVEAPAVPSAKVPAVAAKVGARVDVKTEPQVKTEFVAAETVLKQAPRPQPAAYAAAQADSDTDDDVPLAERRLSGLGTPLANGAYLRYFMHLEVLERWSQSIRVQFCRCGVHCVWCSCMH